MAHRGSSRCCKVRLVTEMAGRFCEIGNPTLRNGSGFHWRGAGGKVRANRAAGWRPQGPNRKRRFGWEQRSQGSPVVAAVACV